MTEVIIERHPDRPLTPADANAIIERGNDCRAIHRLTWHRSLLSADGQQMICHLTSPDVESVRIALKSSPLLMKVDVWGCTVRDAPDLELAELAQANVLASFRFEQPVTPEQLTAIEGCGGTCLQNHRVRMLRTFVASNGRRVLCLCLAADAESVRIALRDSQPPVERIYALQHFYG
jgi:hypothetical protein